MALRCVLVSFMVCTSLKRYFRYSTFVNSAPAHAAGNYRRDGRRALRRTDDRPSDNHLSQIGGSTRLAVDFGAILKELLRGAHHANLPQNIAKSLQDCDISVRIDVLLQYLPR